MDMLLDKFPHWLQEKPNWEDYLRCIWLVHLWVPFNMHLLMEILEGANGTLYKKWANSLQILH